MTTRRSFLYLTSAGALAALAACSSSGGSAGSTSSASASGAGATAGGSASAGASAAPSGSASASAVAPDPSVFPVTVTDGKGELTIEALPEKVAVMDITALDTLVALGVQDRVVGVAANDSLPSSLAEFFPKAEIVGTLQEPDAEKIDALGADLVIVGGRSADAYDSVAQDFTTLLMPGDRSSAFADRLTSGSELLGKVFGVSAKATQDLDAYKARVEQVKAKGSSIGTGLIVLTSGGEVTAYGPGSRFGLIHDDLGVAAAIPGLTPETHGEKISFERINEANPDWLFVVDRDAAIGESGKAAKEILDTELVTSTTAWTKNQVVYLDGQRWYIIGAGLHNAPAMVDEIATAIKA